MSCLGIDGAYRAAYPEPDGSLATQDDRQHMAYKYPGIAAGAPAADTIMAQERFAFRRIFGRVWGRMN